MRFDTLPAPENRFLAEHVLLLRDSLKQWTGRELVPYGLSAEEAARKAIAGKERTRLRRIFVRLQEAITGA